MNNVTMTGNLTRDPESRELAERLECKLRLAVDNGIYPPTFIDVRTFDAHAEACAAWLRKGRKVGVTGKLALDEWGGGDGRPRQRYSVIGKVEFLDRPRQDGEVEEDRGGRLQATRPRRPCRSLSPPDSPPPRATPPDPGTASPCIGRGIARRRCGPDSRSQR